MALTPKRFTRFATWALELAATSEYDVVHKMCAIVVSKSHVLSVGYNQPKTHPISVGTPQEQLHAEMHALIRCQDPEGADVIVVRSKPSGKAGLAKPCDICLGVLRRYGVRRVFYTINGETPSAVSLQEMRL